MVASPVGGATPGANENKVTNQMRHLLMLFVRLKSSLLPKAKTTGIKTALTFSICALYCVV